MKNSLILVLVVSGIKLFSQNVGIGTNNPLSKLHVAGTIRSDTLIGPGVRSLFAAPNGRIYDSLVIPSTLNWKITGNSNITAANFLGTTNASDIIFKTNSIEWARLLSTGNFGINTPTPLEKLHVNGNILANDGVYAQSSFNVGYSSATVISDIFQPWTDNGIKIYDGNSLSHLHVEALGHCAIQAYGTGGSPKASLENTAYSPLALQDKGGNVGIGTIAPGNKLEITSTTANASGLRFTNLTSASSTVATNGKALSVDVNGDVVLMPSSGNAWELLGNAGTTAGTNFLGTTDAQDLVFKTNNTEKARILSSGNFGIGTSTPGQLLHVNGNALANEFWIFSGAGDLKIHNAGIANTMVFNTSGLQRMRIDNNGLVGINTTAPSSRLEVGAIGGDGITIKATTGIDVGDLMFFDAAGVEKGRIYTNPLAAPGLILSGSSTPASHIFIDNIGNVGIGNASPANRLHITSAAVNTSGLRFANLTSASPTFTNNGKALSVDVNGDVILIASSGNAWELLGNAGTTAGTNFLGTTDAQDLVIKTNNTEKVRVLTTGQVGIGTPAPNASAIVQIVSTTQGVMFPSMTTAQRLAIASPAVGLLLYDVTANILMSYNGTRWQEVGGDPIGAIEAFHKSMVATPALPWGWVECNGQVLADAESPYNGQTMPLLNANGQFLRGSTVSGVMQTESVGSHSHTGATTIDGSHNHTGSTGSVNSTNGRLVPWDDNLGTDKMDATNTGQLINTPPGGGGVPWDGLATVGNFLTTIDQLDHTHAISTDGNHNHTFTTNVNTGTETRPANMSVVWIIRIK